MASGFCGHRQRRYSGTGCLRCVLVLDRRTARAGEGGFGIRRAFGAWTTVVTYPLQLELVQRGGALGWVGGGGAVMSWRQGPK